MSYKKRLFIFFGIIGMVIVVLVVVFILRLKSGVYKFDSTKIKQEVKEFYQ